MQGNRKFFCSASVKVAQIHSQLDAVLAAGPEEMPGEKICLAIWEHVGSDEVDSVFRPLSSTNWSLVPCPSWLVKSCEWILAVVNSYLSKRVIFFLTIKETSV